ncbi:unnamed protein product [Pleuronectes platessa]|uniref:Uncharacterized protein n=1 Tax=Pleuronectes platessa TaxID=8262 RepID=A0A9N7YXP7_PLEPL|nr:unnamed protein product [Pleuronectes platessa]
MYVYAGATLLPVFDAHMEPRRVAGVGVAEHEPSAARYQRCFIQGADGRGGGDEDRREERRRGLEPIPEDIGREEGCTLEREHSVGSAEVLTHTAPGKEKQEIAWQHN